MRSAAERAAQVEQAAAELPAAIAHAMKRPTDTARWAVVESLGATVHRQSRLLAGKPRGG